MKKLLKALGITIALTAIGVGVRARVKKNTVKSSGVSITKKGIVAK